MPLPSTPSTLDTYGGVKVDYSDAVDGSTDRSAVEVNQVFCDVAQGTRMTPKARLAFHPTDGITLHQAMWGNTLPLKPTWVKGSTGVFNITLPASITDALGVVHAVSVDAGFANVQGATCYQSNVTITSANTLTVRTWNAAGAVATDPVSTTVVVFLF